ncbi:hypothetical protein ACFL59_07215 [Planctomycetota bacterium]
MKTTFLGAVVTKGVLSTPRRRQPKQDPPPTFQCDGYGIAGPATDIPVRRPWRLERWLGGTAFLTKW